MTTKTIEKLHFRTGPILRWPSPDDLKPTPREISLMQALWNWHLESARSRLELGVPPEGERQ